MKSIRAIAPLFMLSLCFSSCTQKIENEKILHWRLNDDIKSLDPAHAYDEVSLAVMPLVMESLYQYTYTKLPLELEPLLAEAMPRVSPDRKTYTIKIKKGVNWQDDPVFPDGKGRELVAEDFVYSWKRMLLPEIESPGTWIFEGKLLGWDEYKKRLLEHPAERAKILLEETEGLKALDHHTLQFKLLQPYPQLLNVLAMGFGAPVLREAIEKYGQNGLAERMIGTGPFRLVRYVKGSTLTLEKNPNFRSETFPSEGDEEAKSSGLLNAAGKRLPFLDKIDFQIIREEQPAWLQFMKGNLDAAGIPKDNFVNAVLNNELRPELAQKGIHLYKAEELTIWYLNFNMKDKLLGSNEYLRRAISMAIDREQYIKKFLNGRGKKATSLIPIGIAGNTGRREIANDYNLEKAKEFLAKAGYPGGKGLPTIKYDIRGPSISVRQEAEFFQRSLAEIGVTIEVVSNTLPGYLEKEKNGNLQFSLGGWGADYPDAENFLFLLYSKNVCPGPNSSNYANPAFDKLYEKIAQMPDSPARKVLIAQAEEIVLNDGVWGNLYYPVTYSIYHGWLRNNRMNGLIKNDLKYYDLDLAQKKGIEGQIISA